MKNFLVNLLLAFVIWQLAIYISNETTPQVQLEKEVALFNQDVEYQQVLKDYHIPKETQSNQMSQNIEAISNFSREIISVFVDMTMGICYGFD